MNAIKSGVINLKTGQVIACRTSASTMTLDILARDLNREKEGNDYIVFSFDKNISEFVFRKIESAIHSEFPEQVKYLKILRNEYFIGDAKRSLEIAEDALAFSKETRDSIDKSTKSGAYIWDLIDDNLESKQSRVDAVIARLSVLNKRKKSLEEPQYLVFTLYGSDAQFDEHLITDSPVIKRLVVPYTDSESEAEKHFESLIGELADESGSSFELVRKNTTLVTKVL